ncbi:uncharacterized protein [Montipora capricornis]|uniref:uncharacterized protein isoform X1 n=1 Tax=Montipora capricornis TaxID=246305 RepID=UPI0035F1D7D6
MGDGNELDEPHGPKYCEVIQIGIEDDTAEVTIFYTPDREFQVFNGYVSENKDDISNGRRYRKLRLVTSKANVIEFRRYYDNGDMWRLPKSRLQKETSAVLKTLFHCEFKF